VRIVVVKIMFLHFKLFSSVVKTKVRVNLQELGYYTARASCKSWGTTLLKIFLLLKIVYILGL